jgi:hypothetical protein
MIKKALPSAFLLMPQTDRIIGQMAGVLWTFLWKSSGSCGHFCEKGRPCLLAGQVEGTIDDHARGPAWNGNHSG